MSTVTVFICTLFFCSALSYHQPWGWPRWYASRHPRRHHHPHGHFAFPQYHGPVWFRYDPFGGDFYGQGVGHEQTHSHPNGQHHAVEKPEPSVIPVPEEEEEPSHPVIVETQKPFKPVVDPVPVMPVKPVEPVHVAEPTKPTVLVVKPTESQEPKPTAGVKHPVVDYKLDPSVPLQADYPGCHVLDDTVRSMLESNCLLVASVNADNIRCFKVSCLNSCEGKDGERHQANSTWHEQQDRAECTCQPFANLFYFPIPALATFAPHPLHRRCDWNGCVSRTGHFHEVGEFFRTRNTRCKCLRRPDPYLVDIITTHSYVCEDGSYEPSLPFSDSARVIVKT